MAMKTIELHVIVNVDREEVVRARRQCQPMMLVPVFFEPVRLRTMEASALFKGLRPVHQVELENGMVVTLEEFTATKGEKDMFGWDPKKGAPACVSRAEAEAALRKAGLLPPE